VVACLRRSMLALDMSARLGMVVVSGLRRRSCGTPWLGAGPGVLAGEAWLLMYRCDPQCKTKNEEESNARDPCRHAGLGTDESVHLQFAVQRFIRNDGIRES
jgi:hypothetical protein